MSNFKRIPDYRHIKDHGPIPNLPKQIIYNPNTRLGGLQPYVIRYENPNGLYKYLYFHISDRMIYKLEAGMGTVYGRQEYGPWCMLFVFRYRVTSFKILEDKEKIKELEEELFS